MIRTALARALVVLGALLPATWFSGGVGLPAMAAAPIAVAAPINTATKASLGGLTLVSQTAVVEPDGTFRARIDLGPLAEVPDLRVATTIYSVLDDPEGLTTEPTSPINRLPAVPLADLPVDGAGVLTLDIAIRGGGATDNEQRVRIPGPGVYPLVVELSDGQGVVGSLRLELIRLPQPGSTVRSASVALAVGEPGGFSLTAATELLRDHRSVPTTVLLGQNVLQQLRSDRSAARALASAVGRRPVVAALDPDLDPSALTAIGQDDIYLNAAADAAASMAAVGLSPDSSVAILNAPLTAAGADLVVRSGASVVVAGPDWSGAPTGVVATSSGPLTIVGFDPGPLTVGEAGPTATGDDQILAHRQLARLTMEPATGPALRLGGFADDRAPSADASPAVTRLLLDVLSTAAAAAGPFAPVDMRAAVADVAADELAPAPTAAQDLSKAVAGLARAQELLVTYDTFFVSGPSSPAVYRQRLAQALDRTRTDTRRLTELDEVVAELEDGLTLISLPADQSVTLAARRVPMPLTIDNRSDGERSVRLRFKSDKFVVAEQDQLITVGPGVKSINVEVEARSLGESPLEVTLLTPDRAHVLSTTRFRVRSTAVPGLGLAISAAGLVGLAAWWYVSIKRKRDGSRKGSDEEASELDRTEPPVGDSVVP